MLQTNGPRIFGMYALRPSSFTAVRGIFCLSALALGGCDGAFLAKTSADVISVSGNWQLHSTAAAAAKLNAFSGELTGSSVAMTGIFHSNSAGACVAPSSSFQVSGAADSRNMVSLTGALAGGNADGERTVGGGRPIADQPGVQRERGIVRVRYGGDGDGPSV